MYILLGGFFVSLSLRIFLVLFHKSCIIGQEEQKPSRVILDSETVIWGELSQFYIVFRGNIHAQIRQYDMLSSMEVFLNGPRRQRHALDILLLLSQMPF